MKFVQFQVLLLTIVIYGVSCSTSNKVGVDLKNYQIETTKIGDEVREDSSALIKRGNPNLVVLSFFEEFDDTVEVYLNNRKIVSWYINKENNPSTSSGYSGKDIAISNSKRDNVITIRLLQQRKYIRFVLQKKYALYTIQRYGNIWYVNPRNQSLILK